MLLLAACTQVVPGGAAQEASLDTACALDGMVLKDFPGPKAQIQYAEGKADFYCDLMELFTVVLVPEQKRRIAGMYVQDMGKADWDHPAGHWIAAKSAFYVVGSQKHGSMGATFASFSSPQDAAAFEKQEGGQVLPFDQITPEMASKRGAGHEMMMAH